MINAEFTHYIITRYNIPLEGWEKDRNGRETLDEGWMEQRYDLFRNYCLPSVVHQSEKNFKWVIYLDEKTGSAHVQKIMSLVEAYNEIEVRYSAAYNETHSDFVEILTNTDTQYIITSRLDNDDALGQEFVRTVQSNFIPRDKVLLNLLNGHGYDPHRKVLTSMKKIRMNHFTSLIELKNRGEKPVTVRGFRHDEVPGDFEIRDIDSKYSWLKIIHERNMKNRLFGYPVFSNKGLAKYSIDPVSNPIDLGNTMKYATWWLQDGLRRKLHLRSRH